MRWTSALLLCGCVAPKPSSPPTSQATPQLVAHYAGAPWTVGVASQGELQIQSPPGWVFNRQAPSQVWVYSNQRLGNAPQRVDTPNIVDSAATCMQVPLAVVPHRSGPATLHLRVSSALCRETLCVPIDQELALVAPVREESKQ